MDELVWIALVLIGILALPLILAIVAMNKAEKVSRELFKLRGEISQLRSSMVHPIDTAEQNCRAGKITRTGLCNCYHDGCWQLPMMSGRSPPVWP